MDLIQLLQSMEQQIKDAAASAEALGKVKFEEGAASRQGEIDAQKAEIEALKARIAELESQPEKKYSQEELDKAVADAVAAAVPPAVKEAIAAFAAKVQELHDQEEGDLEAGLKAIQESFEPKKEEPRPEEPKPEEEKPVEKLPPGQ